MGSPSFRMRGASNDPQSTGGRSPSRKIHAGTGRAAGSITQLNKGCRATVSFKAESKAACCISPSKYITSEKAIG